MCSIVVRLRFIDSLLGRKILISRGISKERKNSRTSIEHEGVSEMEIKCQNVSHSVPQPERFFFAAPQDIRKSLNFRKNPAV